MKPNGGKVKRRQRSTDQAAPFDRRLDGGLLSMRTGEEEKWMKNGGRIIEIVNWVQIVGNHTHFEKLV